MSARLGAAAFALGALTASRLSAQTVRVATWGSYEGVTGSQNWTTAGAQVTLASPRGHAAWVAGELMGRFGETDGTERIGGVLHPIPRWWVSVEAGTAVRPQFMPKNSWEADATALVARRASLGLGYRRWNYVVGAVDIVIPHLALETRSMALDLRVFVSRNPAQRTDAAFYGRAATSLARGAAWWISAGAGRESYLVGAAPSQQVRSLQTLTGAAGVRLNAGKGVTIRMDVSVVRSRPVLSRRGLALGVERSF